MAKKRSEIPSEYKWDLSSLYLDEAGWESDYAQTLKAAQDFTKYKGTLAKNAATLLEAFAARDAIWQVAERLFVYARQRRDEDNSVSKYQALADRAQALFAKISATEAFFLPEITGIDGAILEEYQKELPELAARYGFVLKKILRKKPHTLSATEETLIARLSEALAAPSEVFSMLNDADMKFGEIRDENGELCELTHGTYIRFLESKDRSVRKAAYEALYSVYEAHKNALAANYRYNVKTDGLIADIRHYPSALAMTLSSGNVPENVYMSLIEAVHTSLPALHKYLNARRKLLGLGEKEKLEMFDVYVPLVSIDEKEIPYEKAIEMLAEALAPLGDEYVSRALAGIKSGWVDVYENEGKSSGAYSFGSYDSKPYILMNYAGKLKDVFTLVHEMGHSMHSLYTRETQAFTYGGHSIFTAEVASTVNENLLLRYLLANAKNQNERAYYLNFFIEEQRATVFRQTMFAEFEKLAHEAEAKGEVLTCDFLCNLYGSLNEKYFGANTNTDDYIRLEWSRIPHFYRAFYVYQYATGFSAASAITQKILSEGEPAASRYREFLKTGDSDDPIELLRIAGVDMDKPETVSEGLKLFGELVDEFITISL